MKAGKSGAKRQEEGLNLVRSRGAGKPAGKTPLASGQYCGVISKHEAAIK
jgi:hypothetical protein